MRDISSEGLVPGRVSLIVPCYNVDRFLDRFVASVLEQSYRDLEVILVNDGATDGTGAMLRAAVPRLQARGCEVKLIEQENKGLGGAVDTGLKHFTGEFLMWPDPDDWLTPNSVERRVELMRQNPDVALLRTNAALYNESSGEFEGHFMPPDAPPTRPTELFENLLFLRRFHAPVCHLVRSALFLEVHPTRSIYFSRVSSQNFQLLVPLVESFPVLQVHETLASYCVRADSRSRASSKSDELQMRRFDQLLDLTEQTVPRLKTYRPEALRVLQNFHYRRRMLPRAFRAAMHGRAGDLIDKSDLPPARKRLARSLLRLRCGSGFRAMDEATGRIASRALARTFDQIVEMPESEVRWLGGGPLWASPAETGSGPEGAGATVTGSSGAVQDRPRVEDAR